jgi:anti-sigma factor RsiW
MKHDRIAIMLAEYHEGTISSADRALVEGHLAGCPDCRRLSESVAHGFAMLHRENTFTVPEQYFVNLLPNIRRRMEEPRVGWLFPAFPLSVQRFLAPVSAVAIVVCMVGLYALLSAPPADTSVALRELVAQVPREELSGMAESPIVLTEPASHLRDWEFSSDPTLASGQIGKQLFAEEIESGSSIAVDAVLENLTEDEVASVLQRFTETTIL